MAGKKKHFKTRLLFTGRRTNIFDMDIYVESSKMELVKPSQSYANSLLDATGFKFQPRNRNLVDVDRRLDAKRFSNLDIDVVIRDVNTQFFSSLINEVVWCEINEADLKLYGDMAIVRLIQVAQLIIEYLIHAKDTLALNLNALAKKYSAKKRELKTLSKSPNRIHTESPGSRASWPTVNLLTMSSNSSIPLRECNPMKPPPADCAASSSTTTLNNTNQGFHLHVIISSTAEYLTLNVEESITVQNLKNKLISRLLLRIRTNSTNFDTHSLFYKDIEMNDCSLTLNDYCVGNEEALVFMPRRQTIIDKNANIPLSNDIESKLTELTSIATSSHEELILATRAFQFQLSMQEESKDALLRDIGKQITHLEVSLVESLRAALRNNQTSYENVETTASLGTKCAFLENTDEIDIENRNILQNNVLCVQESTTDCDESRGQSDVPLRVDTSAAGFNVLVSPFHPPSEIGSPSKLRSEIDASKINVVVDSKEKIETPRSMNCPVNSNLEIEFSMNSLNSMLDETDEITDKLKISPTKDYFLYHGNVNTADNMAPIDSPSTGSEGVVSTMQKDDKLLSWSSDNCSVDGNDSECIGGIIHRCSSTVLRISSGMTTTSEADDLQSIAISQAEPERVNHHAEVDLNKKKKKGHFHLLKKVTKGMLLSK